MAVEAGWEAAKNTFNDPQGAGTGLSSRSSYYDRLEAYYDNTAYASWHKMAAQWEKMRGDRSFYRYHRTILNPTFRLVKFYRDSIYKGPLSSDGENLPDGTQIAIPFAEGTPKPLKLAIAQLWEWSGWQHNMLRLTTNVPKLGNVLAEVVDLPWQGKVVIKLWKPHYIKDIVLDEAGNPKYVCIEYKISEQNRQTKKTREYVYRREMDSKYIRTYMDDKPYDYSQGVTGAEWEHPYGFLPARWFRHMVDELDSDYGLPAIWPALEKIDELNELVSQGHDQLSKIFNSPLIIRGGTKPADPPEKSGRTSRRQRASESSGGDRTDKEKINYVYVGADGGAETLELPMSEALEWVKNTYLDIEADLPELGFPRRLADMSSITGPAATRVLRDVMDAHLSVQANYDHDTRRLFQMAVAIAGHNMRQGIWAAYAKAQGKELTPQQERFADFDLDSYKAGKLDFTIVPRPLIVATELEKWQTRFTRAQAIDIEVNNLSVPEEQGWEEMQYPPEKITTWKGVIEEEKKQNADALAAAQQANQANADTQQQQQAPGGAPFVPPVQR